MTILSCFFFMRTEAQVKKTVREQFNVPKSGCKIYAFKVDSCLKASGFFKDEKDEFIYKDNIELATYKILLGNKKVLPDYDFLVDIAVNEELSREKNDPRHSFWTYGVLEVGYSTEELAEEAFQKAEATAKEAFPMAKGYSKDWLFRMNHVEKRYMHPAFCIRKGKSVIFIYNGSFNMNWAKLGQIWKDDSTRPKFD